MVSKFAARKTANLSGDIRKAFHMCKVAAETVFEEYSNGKRQVGRSTRPIVRISDVQRGSRDMFTSIVLKAVSCSTDYEALLLISLGALKKDRDDGRKVRVSIVSSCDFLCSEVLVIRGLIDLSLPYLTAFVNRCTNTCYVYLSSSLYTM